MDFLTDDEIKAKHEEMEKKEQEFGGDKREKVLGGVHDLFLCKVECDTNRNGTAILKLTYNKDHDQKTYRIFPRCSSSIRRTRISWRKTKKCSSSIFIKASAIRSRVAI